MPPPMQAHSNHHIMDTRHQALLVLVLLLVVAHTPPLAPLKPPTPPGPQPTFSGYIPLDSKPGSSLYYAFWEAANATTSSSSSSSSDTERPILLWLQGGPGCASTFGAFYEIGPHVTAADGSQSGGKLVPNPFAWSQEFALLVIDQPIGTGYSIAASEDDIPQDMSGMSQDLYLGIWGFFDAHRQLQHRPLFITGESYAGKYIPSIAHYILQVESSMSAHQQPPHNSRHCRRSMSKTQREQHSQDSKQQHSGATAAWRRLLHKQQHHQQPSQQQQQACWTPKHAWPQGQPLPPPVNFQLMGVAIGNGLVDPLPQTRALASVVFNMGLVSEAVQSEISVRTEEVVQLVQDGIWQQATTKRSALLEFIQQQSGVATLLDVRRTEGYDAHKAVDALLDSADVRKWMGASDKVPPYSSCSSVVERVMAADVMRSCLVLVEDILEVLPVLLYQGQFDAQDGVAGSNAWIKALDWDHTRQFEQAEGQLWYAQPAKQGATATTAAAPVAAGWQRRVSTLTQVMIRNSGHMAPRDQPQAAQAMIQQWVADVLADAGWGPVPWPTGAWGRA